MLTEPHYDRFYRKGGWSYDLEAQEQHLREVLVPATGWRVGDRVIEIGAGMGHQAELLRRMGFAVVAIDLSVMGVQAARRKYPELEIEHGDLTTWGPPGPGHVFARGASPWHYALDGVNELGIDVPAVTARCFGWIPSGGTFVLQIVTDFSGTRRRNRETGVWNNPLDAYRGLFERFGAVRITDWGGRAVQADGRPDRGVIVVTRKA